MNKLTFSELRKANIGRLPQFKNRKGEPAHTESDGSDWSPAQWLQAVVGELGEYSNLRKKFERGDIDREEFQEEAAKELADVQIYLDLLAFQLGIDMGSAITEKFNIVSARVGSTVFIGHDGLVEQRDADPTVYSRPECIFNYCSNPDYCRNENHCQNAK